MVTSRPILDRLFAAVIVLAALVLFVLFSRSVAGAPVPKRPAELTAEMVVGTWHYEWSSYTGGCIAFEKNSTYSAQHEPGSPRVYYGTWIVKGDTVTITEWAFNADLGATSGPQDYRFVFDVSKYPLLSGLSNGHAPVKLTNPKR